MGIPLATLTDRLASELNAPGESFFDVSDQPVLVRALANGFWNARLDKMFVGYRVDEDDNIVPVDGDTDLAEELHQLVVLFTAMKIIEAKMIGLLTHARYKAGPVEAEERRSAEVLAALLKAKREDLNRIRIDLAAAGLRTAVGVIDLFCSRNHALATGEGYWALG